uniref:dihydrolipoamide acetyltransferase family protein n=1 Tax=Bacillus sp. OTU530 TaxID=3043862 RepID=UPI00101CF096|nr:dihydrolipoamide acetyltransferase family protein [Ectobacillus funiculus]
MAREKITMPQLGESVTEGTISRWLVSVGDHVKKYDPLAEVMTDKVNAEIPSSFEGVIQELVASEGDTLLVGETICIMEIEEIEKEISSQSAEAATAGIQESMDTQTPVKAARYSPAVLRLAQEHNIDLAQVRGTGLNGRITRKDLLKLVELGNIPIPQAEVPEPVLQAVAPEPAVPQEPKKEHKPKAAETKVLPRAVVVPAMKGDAVIPVSGVRKTIAANMLRSKQEIPHAWMMIEVDVTNLVTYRDRIKDEFKQREGFNLTYFAFFVKAVAQALKEFPQVNSMWAGDAVIQKKDVHISIAVATENELFVPVVKHADEKTIKGIARDISELARKVRTKSLKPDDMQGGTFTVNNTGSFGSVQSMGIINYPQAAILQIETIVKRPVVVNGNMLAIRDMVNLCLSLDHRVLDGLICGKFLARVKEILENTSEEHTPIY